MRTALAIPCGTALLLLGFSGWLARPQGRESVERVVSARVHIVSSVEGLAPTRAAKDVLAGSRVTLQVVVDGPRDEGTVITWYEVKAERRTYDNTRKGLERVRYVEHPVGEGWTITPPTAPGTRRYRIDANISGRRLSSAPNGWQNGGELSALHRISLRERDDLPGWMTAWANLPYILGSTEQQVEQFIGGDCADVITGALRRLGRTDVPYTYSQGFGRYGKRIFSGYITTRGRFVLKEGEKRPPVRFERGDLLVFRKPSTHVAVFAAPHVSGTTDPIRVVHTYGEPGVVVEQIYALAQGPLGSVWGGLRNLVDRLLGRGPYRTAVSAVEVRVDEVEVVRLK